MTIRIGQNIASLKAQMGLNDSTSALTKSFQRLSSGLRINSAGDDPAGLALSDSLKAASRIFSQGIRNVNDAISLTNAASSTLESLSIIIQRQQELAEQAGNGIWSTAQRRSMQSEADALSQEFQRIVESTAFNRISLLDGSLDQGLSVQAGLSPIMLDFGSSLNPQYDTFAEQRVIQPPIQARNMNVADLNNDGNSDIIASTGEYDTVMIFLGNGDGSFIAPQCYSTADRPTSVIVGDLDGDGIQDLLLPNGGSDQLSVLIGNGDGTFKEQVCYAAGRFPNSITLGDVNGDSVLDAVAANSFNEEISIFLGNSNGTFNARTSYKAGFNPQGVTLADVNYDGTLDILSTNVNSDNISVLIGNGDGSFKAQTCFTAGDGPYALSLADFNHDGLVDVVTTNRNSNDISVLIGNSDGSFKAQSCFAAGTGPRMHRIADMNGDGLFDVVALLYDVDQTAILFGNTDGSFSAPSYFAVGDAPTDIALADLNHDGFIDITTANPGGSTMSVLLSAPDTDSSRLSAYYLNLMTTQGARDSLSALDKRLEGVSALQGQIGAMQSRLEVAVQNLQSLRAGYSAAADRICDVDVAEESANLVRFQIIQQAQAAILAQANQSASLVLKLLE